MWRRTFLAGSIEAAAAAFLARTALAAPSPTPTLEHPGERRGDMLYRPLGSTGATVSAIGLGGFHIGNQSDEMESIRIIRAAVDRGITFLDNCWDYNGGASEDRMGKALMDGYRDKVFLMTKIDGRTRDAAAKQIDESLRRLRTDHVDLMQVHETIRLEDPDRVFADGGAIEALTTARQAGKIRFIGFTGHKDPVVHNRMLDAAKANGFRFDAVQMPLNVMDAHFRSFEREVLPRLVHDRVGVLGMKSLGEGKLLESGTASAIECLHYALNLPTSVVITGVDSMAVLDQACEAARTFRPMTEPQLAALLAKTAKAASRGEFEPFKTSSIFDATAEHPEWLGEEPERLQALMP
jgi:predicted aldo/keto reductase-like oxidoreductase